MGRLSIILTIKKLNIYLSKTHSLHSKMTYIAFFFCWLAEVCFVSLTLAHLFFSPWVILSCPFVLLSISVLSLCGGGSDGLLSVFSDSDAAAHACLGVLSHWLNVIALVQKCPFAPVSLSWEICRWFVLVSLRSSYRLWNTFFFHSCCKNLYLCCSVPQLLLIFCFFFLCPHRISLRIQRLSPHPCVCARACVCLWLPCW